MMHRLAIRRAALATTALAASLSAATPASAATCNWLTTLGSWVNPINWSCGAQPGSGDDVAITTGGAVVSVSGASVGAATINLGAGNAINVDAGSTLAIYNGALTNNGTITVSNNSDFRNFGGTINVTGNGSIVLDSSVNNARLFSGAWIFGSGQTVRGAGQIGINQGVFTNNGLVSANVAGSALSIDASGGNGGAGIGNGFGTNNNSGFHNTGIMQATGGGSLNFEGGLYENSATGVIRAQNGSFVNLNGDSRVLGGTLTTTGTGVIQAVGTSQYLQNVTLSAGSNLKVQNDNLYLNTSFVNNGTVTLGGAAGFAQLINEGGTLTISGTGTIAFDASNGSTNRIYGGSIVFGSNHTLTGTGQLGINQAIVTNNGLLSVNSGNLSIDISGGNGGAGIGNGVGTNNNSGLFNNGIIQATGGSAISLEGGLYENATGGVIRATNGSTIYLNGDSRVFNGALTSDATSSIIAQNNSQYLTSVTLTSGSNLKVQNDNLYLNTSLTNDGTVRLGGVAGFAQLINESGQLAINGSGTIILDASNGATARIYGGNITFGAGQTVQGAGQLGINQTTFTINNVFSANAGSTLSFDVSGGNGGTGIGNGVGFNNNSGLLNSSTIQATGGSSINLEGGLYENTATGVIQALNGSFVNLNGDSRVVGGTLTTAGTGVIQAFGTTQYLTGVTLSSGSSLKVQNDNLVLNTSFVNNGTVTLGGAAGFSQLINESGTLTMSGTGSIVLDNSNGANARIYNGSIVFASNQALTGTGSLGINQTLVTNNGLFSVGSGGNLSIDVSGGSGGVGINNGVGTNGNSGLLNNSIIQATGGSAISFEGGLYENAAGGIIRATNGSTIYLGNDSRIFNGTLTSDATSTFVAQNTAQYLTNVTLSSGSSLRVQNDDLRVNTALTNNGTITLGGAAGGARMIGESGSVAINGSGTIVLDGSNGAAPLIYAGNFTFGAGQTVRGAGQLGANQTIFTNNGLISADANGGNLSIDVSSGSGGVGINNGVGTNGNSGFLNNTIMQAANGGSLSFEGGLYENGANGLIQALNGSFVNLNSDSRILNGTLTSGGTGVIQASNTTQYLQNVTLAAGSKLNMSSDSLLLNTRLTNNGTVTVDNGSALRSETANLLIDGNGSIVLGGAGSNVLYGGLITIGSGQTITGSGSVGINQTIFSNSGNILAGGNISIDVSSGSGGVGINNGVGTNGNSGFYNDNGGQVQANNGGATLTLNGGLYEQAAGGSFSVGTGSTFDMTGDTSLVNLKSGGVLDKGLYFAFSNGVMNLRSSQTGSITTIGTGAAGTDTVVSLDGAGSVIEVTPTNSSPTTTIDQSLQSIAQSGKLILSGGRSFTAANGAFGNAGVLQLSNGSFTSPSGFTNSGLVTGNGTVGTPITNTGSVVADGGTLNSQAITGATGTIQSNAGATLNLAGASGNSTAGFLTNNGNLALGGNNITVTNDYQNANFGSGNAFNAHANVSGSGLILATSATMDLSGPGLSGNTLNVGNVRLGNSSSTTLTITNNGTDTILRGAVQSPVTNTVSISSSNFVIGPNGGSTSVTLSYTGNTAGSLAGNTVNVVNNFDNVADRTLTITGAAYNPAAASILPATVDLGATRVGVGTLSGSVTITNTAPVSAFSEKLAVTGVTNAGGASGTQPAGLINPGASASSTVSIGTGTAGNFSGTVTYGLATDGTGTSGLAQAALASQSVTVNGRVYQTAAAQLATTNVNFGVVRQGSSAPTANVGVTNTASGALTDTLNTTVSSTPAGITGTAPGALAGGASGNVGFSASTATARQISGSASLGFTSTDPELAPLTLASQNVSFSGTVTELAVAQILKDSGTGTFGGGGTTYNLDLGSFAAGSGLVTTTLGVLNANTGQSFSELLNGTFGASGGTGYSFAGLTFTGLQGGSEATPNQLTFNYTGLGAGTYTNSLIFSGYSSYAGLGNQSLAPITVNVTATVTGGGGNPGAVPEPSTWVMLLFGFGAVGFGVRGRRYRQSVAAA